MPIIIIKFVLMQSAVTYVGYVVDSEGVKADPRKIEAISEFLTPNNLTELRSFMGLVNQLGGFTHQISSAAKPLRDLLKSKNAFVWTGDHDQAFTQTKRCYAALPYWLHSILSFPRCCKQMHPGLKV